MYKCGWNGCEKAYGTLNHLNAHVTMQSHGAKRTPEGKHPCFFYTLLFLRLFAPVDRDIFSWVTAFLGLCAGYHFVYSFSICIVSRNCRRFHITSGR